MMDAYAIVSVPLLLTTCTAIVVGQLISSFWRGSVNVTSMLDQLFGVLLVFTLGFLFWRVL